MISESERERLVVGLKQTLRAVKGNKAAKVFLGDDSESNIKALIEDAASSCDAQIFYIPTMKELGKMCGIDVCASCAVILK